MDNTQRDHIAPQRGIFSMFGGLYRPIELIETDGVCIDPSFTPPRRLHYDEVPG